MKQFCLQTVTYVAQLLPLLVLLLDPPLPVGQQLLLVALLLRQLLPLQCLRVQTIDAVIKSGQ